MEVVIETPLDGIYHEFGVDVFTLQPHGHRISVNRQSN